MENLSQIVICEITDAAELGIIRSLAEKIFPETYREMIPAAQIPYMMELMYGDAVLKKELAAGVKYAVISEAGTPVGYVSWHLQTEGNCKFMRLEKVYLDFSRHGRSIGNMAIRHVIDAARQAGAAYISLNVNKHNLRAQKAYCRAGFYRWKSEKEDVGSGFFKDDYVMRHDLAPEQDTAKDA